MDAIRRYEWTPVLMSHKEDGAWVSYTDHLAALKDEGEPVAWQKSLRYLDYEYGPWLDISKGEYDDISKLKEQIGPRRRGTKLRELYLRPIPPSTTPTEGENVVMAAGLPIASVLELAAHYAETGSKSTILADQIRRITPHIIAAMAAEGRS